MSEPGQQQRPTKKQRELLSFIDGFIKGNGYGPSYREVMRALEYKSVSTVAAHVDGLIAKGYLEKTDTSARSLRVVSQDKPQTNGQKDWLRQELEVKRRDLDASQPDAKAKIAAIDTVAKLFDITL